MDALVGRMKRERQKSRYVRVYHDHIEDEFDDDGNEYHDGSFMENDDDGA